MGSITIRIPCSAGRHRPDLQTAGLSALCCFGCQWRVALIASFVAPVICCKRLCVGGAWRCCSFKGCESHWHCSLHRQCLAVLCRGCAVPGDTFAIKVLTKTELVRKNMVESVTNERNILAMVGGGGGGGQERCQEWRWHDQLYRSGDAVEEAALLYVRVCLLLLAASRWQHERSLILITGAVIFESDVVVFLWCDLLLCSSGQ